jgi:chemotaxis protein CheX
MAALVTETQLRELIATHAARVFSTMLQVAIEPLPDGHATRLKVSGGAVMGFIGLTGSWSGTGSVSCSEALARVVSGKLLMTEFAAVDAEVLDAIGEVANMIIGNVKEELIPSLGPLAISTPTVICGSGLQTRSVSGPTSSTVVFACEGDYLEVRVSLVQAASA